LSNDDLPLLEWSICDRAVVDRLVPLTNTESVSPFIEDPAERRQRATVYLVSGVTLRHACVGLPGVKDAHVRGNIQRLGVGDRLGALDVKIVLDRHVARERLILIGASVVSNRHTVDLLKLYVEHVDLCRVITVRVPETELSGVYAVDGSSAVDSDSIKLSGTIR